MEPKRFTVRAFWKRQGNGAVTKIPERSYVALSRVYAADSHIRTFSPWLHSSDMNLVLAHTSEHNEVPK